jgi:hypothetical protein
MAPPWDRRANPAGPQPAGPDAGAESVDPVEEMLDLVAELLVPVSAARKAADWPFLAEVSAARKATDWPYPAEESAARKAADWPFPAEASAARKAADWPYPAEESAARAVQPDAPRADRPTREKSRELRQRAASHPCWDGEPGFPAGRRRRTRRSATARPSPGQTPRY